MGVGGTATIVGKAEFDGDVCISGNSILVGNLAVGGTTTITGAVSLASTLSVGGAAHFASTVTIAGNTTLTGNLGVGGTATIVGKAEFDDDVCVSGNSVLVGNLAVGGTTTIGGAASIAGALSVGGVGSFLSTVRVAGDCSLEGQLQLTKSAAAVVCATAINGVTSVSLAFGTAQNFATTVTAAHTLAKPTGCRTGQTGSIFLVQSGGSGTMAYNADWKFIGAEDPTMSTSNGSNDRLDYIVVSASSDGKGGVIQAILTQEYG